MTKEDIKQLIEDNKAKIILAGKVLGAAALVALIWKLSSKSKSVPSVPMDTLIEMPPEDIPIAPAIPEGLIKYGINQWDTVQKGVLEFMLPFAKGDVYPTRLDDLYEILDALKEIPGIDGDTDVWAQFSISRDNLT